MSTPADELAHDAQWQRLDPRMMFIQPVREVLKFLPVLLGLFVAGQASSGFDVPWQLLGIGLPVALGLMRYFTTSFRVAEGRIEMRRGLLNKHLLSARLDRVRTVDLTASPIQRAFGLTTVRVGTGTVSTVGEDRLDLDGLPTDRARALREALLRTSAVQTPVEADAISPERVLLRLDPAWARFAPLTSSGLVLGAAALGVGSQLLDGLGFFDNPSVYVHYDEPDSNWWLLVPVLLIGAAVVFAVLAVAAYLVNNWGFVLTQTRIDGSWHLRRGLFTTRETSLDGERVGGVTIGEPLGLRLAGGARLSAIVTGLGATQSGSSVLVPPAPRAVVSGVAAEVLDTTEPVIGALTQHGPRARTRRFTRALVPTTVVALALVLAVVIGDLWTGLIGFSVLLLVAAAALAADRARSLGHALTERHFVARSGSLYRRREVLETRAVIGWNFQSSWFQRRAGLTTLVATTAGGSQSCTAIDVPEDEAVGVATAGVPGLVEQFATDILPVTGTPEGNHPEPQ